MGFIKIKQGISFLLISLFLFFLNGKALAYTETVRDPFESFNRIMFNFNEILDKALLKPIAKLYLKIMPRPLTKGISNFFVNLDGVPTTINDLLQAKFYQATNDAWRLLINSTIGVAGFFDVAQEIGLPRHSEDFGLTMAHWGFRNASYLVLPFFGPSTTRDAIGFYLNYNYLSVYPYIEPTRVRYELYGLYVISRRADLIRFQNILQQAAVDKYAFVRNAYLQRRAYAIEKNGQTLPEKPEQPAKI